MHWVGPPPSFNSQVDSLHLWPTSTYNGDPLFLLPPWWGTNWISQYHLRCFWFHHEKHKVSCFTWTNTCPSTTFHLVLSLMGWHCVINLWHPHLGWCYHCQSHSSKFGSSCYFISRGRHNGGAWTKEIFIKIDTWWMDFFPLAIKVFGCLHQ